ncbi:MAG: glycosyltransferase, partial [Acidobacteriota bacterium]
MPQKTHILHLIDGLDYGGAQKLLVTLAEWTPKDRYRVTVCCLQPLEDLREEIEARGVRVLCLGRKRESVLRPHRFLEYACLSLRDIVRYCKETDVSVIQCHLGDAELLGGIAGILAGTRRVLATNHFPFEPAGRKRFDVRNHLRRLAWNVAYNHLVNGVVAVSEDIARQLENDYGVKPKKIHVITNGIGVDSYRYRRVEPSFRESLGLAPGDRVITAVGRLSPQKGHVHLIEAVGRLIGGFPDLQLLIAGEGEIRELLQARSREAGLEGRVHLLGNRRDVADILAVTDIFAMPSIWEGTSLAMLEAMASGR